MSISMVLIPLAIALSVTAKEAMKERTEQKNKEKGQPLTQLAPLQTIFNDLSLLEQTLREHGFAVTVVSENQLTCQAGEAYLDYSRQTFGEPFEVTVSGIQNIDRLLTEIECFEREYKQNVQSYTYNKLVEGLNESNMKITEETVLEDNSILLTIDI
jgi:hypothetical protein